MNIHPMFVHFPVALFTLYCILEILRFKKLTGQVYWFYLKATFVIIGFAVSLPTIITGIMAKEVYPGSSPYKVILVHETFAITTTVVFGIIAFFYVVGWMRRNGKNIWPSVVVWEKRITEGGLGIFLALIGLALVGTTAALGGLLAYGPENDPISGFLYNLIVN